MKHKKLGMIRTNSRGYYSSHSQYFKHQILHSNGKIRTSKVTLSDLRSESSDYLLLSEMYATNLSSYPFNRQFT